jgi:hypothetical protein
VLPAFFLMRRAVFALLRRPEREPTDTVLAPQAQGGR